MKKDVVTWATIFALGISGTFGALKIFATKGELEQLAMESKCGDIEYRIDKVLQRMWGIEDRYGGSSDTTRMKPADRRRYQDLIGQLETWRNYQKQFNCTPKNEGG